MTKAKNSIARAVGQKIQVLRKDHGITAARLAEMIEISQQQMSRYERGVNRVDVDCLVRIADIFEVPVGCSSPRLKAGVNATAEMNGNPGKQKPLFCRSNLN